MCQTRGPEARSVPPYHFICPSKANYVCRLHASCWVNKMANYLHFQTHWVDCKHFGLPNKYLISSFHWPLILIVIHNCSVNVIWDNHTFILGSQSWHPPPPHLPEETQTTIWSMTKNSLTTLMDINNHAKRCTFGNEPTVLPFCRGKTQDDIGLWDIITSSVKTNRLTLKCFLF